MKISILPIKPFEKRDTPKGPRQFAPCLSGNDVLLVVLSAEAVAPKGETCLDGFLLPARRAGDQPRFFVR